VPSERLEALALTAAQAAARSISALNAPGEYDIAIVKIEDEDDDTGLACMVQEGSRPTPGLVLNALLTHVHTAARELGMRVDLYANAEQPMHKVGVTIGELRVIHNAAERLAAQPHRGQDPMGWTCEDCIYYTEVEAEALGHSDNHKHSLAPCPRSRSPRVPVEIAANEHWITFNMSGRQFGFWRATMALYEADEHGAMGEEEVTL
jgi:hypothetical protein